MLHRSRNHDPFVSGFFTNKDFDFVVRTVLGQASYGASDTGEVLAALDSVGEKDDDAWFAAWLGLGDRVDTIAGTAEAAGHSVSASHAYLRAATYYGAAVNAIASLKDTGQLVPTFQKHRAAWDHFVDTTSIDVSRVVIPYENDSLPGYFFRPAADGAARPTFIMVNGSDGPISGSWANGAAAALDRGYNVLLFDGPGQQSMLFERNTSFRPDWEAVIVPVVDYLLTRDDVDAKRLTLYGVSQAGYWVPRALAFEHRIAAAIADPGVVDVSQSWLSQIPASLTKLLDDGEAGAKKFDRDMQIGMKLSPEAERTWTFRARPYQTTGYAETILALKHYNLTDVAAQITTPLLITNPEHEQFWPGQSEQLAQLVPDHATLVAFTAAEGADFHCQPLARTLTNQRMFDWLDERVAEVG